MLAGLAGVLSLDATAFFQSMISRPLVAGIAAGAIVGDLGLGLVVGATLELVWVGALPVGAAGFPDATSGAVVGTGVGWLLGGGGGDRAVALFGGVVAGLVAGAVGRALVGLLRRANERYAARALAKASEEDARGVGEAVALGLLTRFGLGAALTAGFLWAWSGLPAGPPSSGNAYPALLWAAPLGAAAVAARAKGAADRWLLAGGFGVGLVVTLAVRGGL